MEPPLAVSGTSALKFPNRYISAHICAYFQVAAPLRHRYELPASGHIHRPQVFETSLIAMQKVEGSNPFSRFASNPLKIATTPRVFGGCVDLTFSFRKLGTRVVRVLSGE